MIPRDRSRAFNAAAFRKCAEFGIQGLPIPAEYGGSGADPLIVVIAMEALGYRCQDNDLLFSINARMWSFEFPLLELGTEEQEAGYLPRLCRGDIVLAKATGKICGIGCGDRELSLSESLRSPASTRFRSTVATVT
jgi:alkylation response protein AidB-like acyl-CoA dehydrogenase